MDNSIHRINRYPLDNVVCFANTYPAAFEQPGLDFILYSEVARIAFMTVLISENQDGEFLRVFIFNL